MGQPTQKATNYTARSNIEPAQIVLNANGQSAPDQAALATSAEARGATHRARSRSPYTYTYTCVYTYMYTQPMYTPSVPLPG